MDFWWPMAGMGWMMLWMGLGTLVVFGLGAVIVAVIVRWASTAGWGRRSDADPALQEARMRLARGELSIEEYDRIIAKLRESK